jgi:hypothetical protein
MTNHTAGAAPHFEPPTGGNVVPFPRIAASVPPDPLQQRVTTHHGEIFSLDELSRTAGAVMAERVQVAAVNVLRRAVAVHDAGGDLHRTADAAFAAFLLFRLAVEPVR